MKIGPNTFVSVAYELKVDGEIVDQANEKQPLEFIYDAGFLLPAFEAELSGLEPGQSFGFKLSPESGYGNIIDEAVVELPKTAFMVEGKVEEGMLEAGNQIPMMDNQGHRMVGTVKEINNETVLMDFNHPLAGKALNFTGQVIGVREATDADKAKFMGGGCGCGSEGCGDGCGDGCGEGCGEEGCNC